MIILHITDIAHSEGNGVAVAVNNYVDYLSKKCNVAIYCLEDLVGNENAKIYKYLNYSNISNLPSPFNKPDIIIFNEVYKIKYIKLYKECVKLSIPYIIIPHGCLEKNAQNRKKVKKIIGNTFLFNKFIVSADAIQFLNIAEMKHTKFKYKKYIIGGNGADAIKTTNQSEYLSKDLIYIGRYEIKHKGLDMLVNICNSYRKWFVENNVKIQLYGRDSANELVKLNKMIKDNNLQDILIVNGPIYNEEKKKVLQQSYAFIQCSRFEGQPMGIIEALSFGMPCIVTYGTNLGEYIEEKKCGLVSDFSSQKVFENIKSIINNTNLRDEMSKSALENSIKDFNWNSIIDNTISEYKRIIKEK